MTPMLVAAVVAITSALALYTAGVFGERRSGRLRLRHALLFWAGLACDTTGTLIMGNLAQASGSGAGAHAVTGALAIALMAAHAVWAAVTLARGSRDAMRRFHTFSTAVWLAWLVPYIIGLLVGIPAFHLRAVCAAGTSAIVVAVLALVLLRPRRGGRDAL